MTDPCRQSAWICTSHDLPHQGRIRTKPKPQVVQAGKSPPAGSKTLRRETPNAGSGDEDEEDDPFGLGAIMAKSNGDPVDPPEIKGGGDAEPDSEEEDDPFGLGAIIAKERMEVHQGAAAGEGAGGGERGDKVSPGGQGGSEGSEDGGATKMEAAVSGSKRPWGER
ncbi:unnamed protein product, partial [Discosporangium mesarthrocarpum]